MTRPLVRVLSAGSMLAFLFAASPAPAAKRDADEPLRINARSVEANERTGAVVYRGDVVVEQGRLSIRADRIELLSRQGKTELVRATGNPVKLRQSATSDGPELRGEAARVDYHVTRKSLDMSGAVKLNRGGDHFSADVLQYDLVSKSLSASGDEKNNGRVHAVILPGTSDAETSLRP